MLLEMELLGDRLTAVLNARASLSAFGYAEKSGFKGSVNVRSALINMSSKSGCIE